MTYSSKSAGVYALRRHGSATLRRSSGLVLFGSVLRVLASTSCVSSVRTHSSSLGRISKCVKAASTLTCLARSNPLVVPLASRSASTFAVFGVHCICDLIFWCFMRFMWTVFSLGTGDAVNREDLNLLSADPLPSLSVQVGSTRTLERLPGADSLQNNFKDESVANDPSVVMTSAGLSFRWTIVLNWRQFELLFMMTFSCVFQRFWSSGNAREIHSPSTLSLW